MKHEEALTAEGLRLLKSANESGGSVGVIVSGLRKPEAYVYVVES